MATDPAKLIAQARNGGPLNAEELIDALADALEAHVRVAEAARASVPLSPELITPPQQALLDELAALDLLGGTDG